ncbi:MAG TPA: hypothetical protein DEA32_01815 [Firmicutes bacterium]|nr:hypothetical protein [Bacillota bacterium]
MEEKKTFKDRIVARFKDFTPMRYIGSLSMLAVAIICLIWAVMFSVDLGNGVPFFTGPAVGGNPGVELKSYEVIVTVALYVMGLFLAGLFVYEFFFQPFTKKPVSNRELVGGEVVEIKKDADGGSDGKEKNKKA